MTMWENKQTNKRNPRVPGIQNANLISTHLLRSKPDIPWGYHEHHSHGDPGTEARARAGVLQRAGWKCLILCQENDSHLGPG